MKYHKMNDHDLKALRAMVGSDRFFAGDEIEKDYSHDELGTVSAYPDAHILPLNKEEISQIMKYAYAYNIPVTVRGAGTGLVGASVPIFGGILLDISKMNRIIELDKDNLTLRVEPGVLLLDIYEAVEKEGLFYAPDPGEKTATISGNISTNAGGMRAIKYGVTRDWVRGLEVVLPDGSIETFGGKVVKNSTGYSLKDLIIGSEGTLAIITEATLKLMPKPAKTVTLLVPFNTREDAIKAAPQLINDHVLPVAMEFLERQSLQFSEAFLGKKIPHDNHPAYLLLSYDGNHDEALNADVEKASALCIDKYNAIDVYLGDTDERRNNIWTVRGGFLEAIKASSDQIDECDVVLPRSNIGAFLAEVRQLAKDLEIRVPYFGHVGDGNLHIYFCKDNMDEKIWQEKIEKGFDFLYKRAFHYGGLVSGEHGVGYAKKQYMNEQLGPNQIRIMKGIKQSFDPKNILNPGKIID